MDCSIAMQVTRCIAVLMSGTQFLHSAQSAGRCKAKTHGSRPSWCGLLQFFLEEKLGLHVGYMHSRTDESGFRARCSCQGYASLSGVLGVCASLVKLVQWTKAKGGRPHLTPMAIVVFPGDVGSADCRDRTFQLRVAAGFKQHVFVPCRHMQPKSSRCHLR